MSKFMIVLALMVPFAVPATVPAAIALLATGDEGGKSSVVTAVETTPAPAAL